MTAAPAGRRPLPGCPAISGLGTDLDEARFRLVTEDCERGPDGQMTLTEVFGYYQVPGQDSDDLIHADGFAVPIGSPVALMAHKVARSRRRTRIAGNLLRSAITTCRCAGVGGCPAFDDIAMLEAIEHAASQPALARWRCLIRPGARKHAPQLTGECP
jgi:hypothetical protein